MLHQPSAGTGDEESVMLCKPISAFLLVAIVSYSRVIRKEPGKSDSPQTLSDQSLTVITSLRLIHHSNERKTKQK